MKIPVTRGRHVDPVGAQIADLDFESKSTLVLADRCDLCGAQAFGAAHFSSAESPLLFCAHHFTKYEAKLKDVGASLLDERHRVLENEMARKREGVSPD